jgi:peptidylprolyl isomerase
VSATGKEGTKLKVTLKTPMTIKTNSYKVLQEGTGAALKSGQRVCMQTVVYNAKSGEELGSTWKENKKDCSLALDSGSASAEYLKIFLSQKVGAAIAFGMPQTSTSNSTSSTSGSTSTTDPYVYVETIVSVKNDLAKATGTKVSNIPSTLPKVTLASNGKPSITKAELKKYKATKSLVSQTLIKGKGAKVTSTSGLRVQYSGWLLNGTQFDSSWKTGTPLDVTDLSTQVIKGWGQGLKGQTVGSQVLLIIPPSLGYGSTAQGSIPKNSTLVFVSIFWRRIKSPLFSRDRFATGQVASLARCHTTVVWPCTESTCPVAYHHHHENPVQNNVMSSLFVPFMSS